jgi:hypothetical protein
MPQELKIEVKYLSNTGRAPEEIVSAICQVTNHSVTSCDIYNIYEKPKLKNLAGLSPTESLLIILKASYFVFVQLLATHRSVE